MQLVTIGEVKQPTIRDLITQMALRQSDEVQRLKQAVLAREAERKHARLTRRCSAPGQ